MDIIINISIAIVSGAGGAGLIYLASKTTITEKIKGKIKNDYDSKLERLKNELGRDDMILSVATKTLNEATKVSRSERIKAISLLWSKYLVIKKIVDKINSIDSIVTMREFEHLYTSEWEGNEIVDQDLSVLNEGMITEINQAYKEIEEIRPFLNLAIMENITFLITLSSRLIYLYMNVRSTKKSKHWKRDSAITELRNWKLSEEENEIIDNCQLNGVVLIYAFIEQKILKELQDILSGKSDADYSLKHAQDIAEVIKIHQQASITTA